MNPNTQDAMVAIYARRIKRGEISLDSVPERIRDLVREAICRNEEERGRCPGRRSSHPS